VSRREDIDNSIWSDPDFRRLAPAAKLMYLWSFTNPRCGMAGIYKVPLELAAFEMGLTERKTATALAELSDKRFLHYIDHVMWVRTRVKHLRTRTVQIARSIAKDVEQIPEEHPLRQAFLDTYGDHPWLREQIAILAPKGGWEAATTVSAAQRQRVFERDGFACVYCHSTDDLSIDHRQPITHGGGNSEENLQTLCRGCNSRKGPTSDLALEADISEPPNGTSNTRFQGKGKGKGSGSNLSVLPSSKASDETFGELRSETRPR
jgi:hypothetical protein